MSDIMIITDSTACLPGELVEQYHIKVVPLVLVFEGRVYRDGAFENKQEFYELLRHAKNLPTTSPSSPGMYLESYNEAIRKKCSGILCITLSSKVSAMYDSARLAKEMAEEVNPDVPIHVIDSGTAAMAQGFAVLAAARSVANSGDLAQAIRAASEVLERVNLVAFMDTLYYLAKGGRIPKAAAWGAALIQLKPLLEISKGEVKLMERTRTKARAVSRLLEIMEERMDRSRSLHVSVIHANVLDEAESLRQKVSSRFNPAELYVTEFTPVMGTHTGPGLLGLTFYDEG